MLPNHISLLQHCFAAKSVLSQFTLFCREICFVAIYALLRGEKLSRRLYLWRKMTNIRYAWGGWELGLSTCLLVQPMNPR